MLSPRTLEKLATAALVAVAGAAGAATRAPPGPIPISDPYKTYRFELIWSGGPVAGFKAPLNVLSPVVGGSLPPPPPSTPPPPGYRSVPLALSNGITWDTGFAKWATQTIKQRSGVGLYRDIEFVMHGKGGAPARTANLTQCWVWQWTPAGPFKSTPPFAIALIRIQCLQAVSGSKPWG